MEWFWIESLACGAVNWFTSSWHGNVLWYSQRQVGPPRFLSSHPCPQVPTESPPLSSPFQIGFCRHRFRLHLDFSKMGKVGKNHGQSACASRQKRDAYGKFTRGSSIEVVPEASGGWEIPSAAEHAPEDSVGREIPSAFELALRSIARRGCAPAPVSWTRRSWQAPPRPHPCRQSTMWVRFFSTTFPI
jgi:hypothetical protein